MPTIKPGGLDELFQRIVAVRNTFNKDDFPEKTRNELVKLVNFLGSKREGSDFLFIDFIEAHSDEFSSRAAFVEGLTEHCLSGKQFNQAVERRDFVEARKIFNNEIFLFIQSLQAIENKPYGRIRAYRDLVALAPARFEQ